MNAGTPIKAKNAMVVMNTIVERKADRQRKDLKDYRVAQKSAESYIHPNRLKLYSMYSEIDLDNHLDGLIHNQLIARILPHEIRVVDHDGKIDDDLTYMFKASWFHEFVKEVVLTEMWGHTLLFVDELIDDPLNPGKKIISKVEAFPRRNIKPEYGYIVINEYDMDGYDFRNDPAITPWVVELGHPKSLGKFLKLSISYLLKKNALIARGEYIEKFGVPFIDIKTNSTDNEDLDRLEDRAKNTGKGGYIISHEGETVTITETKGGGQHSPFDSQVKDMNEEMSKSVLGVTMTTDNGSSKSQSETHKEVADDVIEYYKLRVTVAVMNSLVPVLMQRGVNFVGKKFEYVEQKDLDKLFDRAIKLLGTGKYNIKSKYILDTFGIEVEDVTTDSPAEEKAENPEKPQPKKKAPKKVKEQQ